MSKDLLRKLLAMDPAKRITAKDALDHDYFWTPPLPTKLEDLPKYPACHEFTAKKRRQQAAQNQPPAGAPPQQQGPVGSHPQGQASWNGQQRAQYSAPPPQYSGHQHYQQQQYPTQQQQQQQQQQQYGSSGVPASFAPPGYGAAGSVKRGRDVPGGYGDQGLARALPLPVSSGRSVPTPHLGQAPQQPQQPQNAGRAAGYANGSSFGR
jgi:serine/threonine protein kinase